MKCGCVKTKNEIDTMSARQLFFNQFKYAKDFKTNARMLHSQTPWYTRACFPWCFVILLVILKWGCERSPRFNARVLKFIEANQ